MILSAILEISFCLFLTILGYGTIENILRHFQNDSADSKAEYKSYAHGAVAALTKIAQKTDLLKIMANHLPSRTRDGLKREETLLLAAIHRAIQPGSKNSFTDWVKTTTLPTLFKFDPEQTTSQHFWDQMDGITEQQLKDCEDAITRHIFELYSFSVEKLILDYTNYHSYIATSNEQNALAKRGHNKQKRYDLRQYSLAVVTTKDVLFPMCSHIYEGNINDQSVHIFLIYPRRNVIFDCLHFSNIYSELNNTMTSLSLSNSYYASFVVSCLTNRR